MSMRATIPNISRSFLILATALCCIPVIAVAVCLTLSRGFATEEFHRRGAEAASSLAFESAPLLNAPDSASLLTVLSAGSLRHGAIAAFVVDGNGAIQACSLPDGGARTRLGELLMSGDVPGDRQPRLVSLEGARAFIYTSAIKEGKRTLGRAGLVLPSTSLERHQTRLRIIFVSTVFSVLVILGVLFGTYATRMRSPIARFVEATQRLAEGRRPDDIPLPESGEFRHLTAAFRSMADMLMAVLDNLSENGREFTPRRYASYISHEIRNSLHRMLGIASVVALKASDHPQEVMHLANDLERQILALDGFCRDILLYSRPVSRERRRVDVNAMIRRLARDYESRGATKFCVNLGPDVPHIMADGPALERALVNLIKNGMDAMSDGGTLSLSTAYDSLCASVKIGVADTGCGMNQSRLTALFQPFQSGKPGGTGLGLAIVAEVLQAHQATVEVQSDVGRGTTFTLTIPTDPTISEADSAGVGTGAE